MKIMTLAMAALSCALFFGLSSGVYAAAKFTYTHAGKGASSCSWKTSKSETNYSSTIKVYKAGNSSEVGSIKVDPGGTMCSSDEVLKGVRLKASSNNPGCKTYVYSRTCQTQKTFGHYSIPWPDRTFYSPSAGTDAKTCGRWTCIEGNCFSAAGGIQTTGTQVAYSNRTHCGSIGTLSLTVEAYCCSQE